MSNSLLNAASSLLGSIETAGYVQQTDPYSMSHLAEATREYEKNFKRNEKRYWINFKQNQKILKQFEELEQKHQNILNKNNKDFINNVNKENELLIKSKEKSFTDKELELWKSKLEALKEQMKYAENNYFKRITEKQIKKVKTQINKLQEIT